ncbi:MAG: hypothetical protein ICV65_15525, partial [Flavisolibacter sp.]|nr:hypothetical protein [Flavisolibacter sp.]
MYPFLLFLFSSFWSCNKKVAESNALFFDSIPIIKPVVPIILETSGIADSKANKGFLWVQEDSGNPSQLYLLGYDGKVAKKIYIKGATNRDWEDMALSGSYIYIADIGDNNAVYPDYTIYKFTEPKATADTVTEEEAIRFKYPDGSHDAEAFLVDPATKDIFIITKRDNPSRIYKLAYPYSTTSINMLQLSGTLPYSGVVSAAISAKGTELIIKTYTNLYYYSRNTGSSIAEALTKSFTKLPYQVEPQGEAVTFANDDSGYFTLS